MRKMTRLGIFTTAGASAAALAVAGFALPASAADGGDSTNESSSTSTDFMSSIEGVQSLLRDTILASGNDSAIGDIGLNAPVVEGPLVSESPVLSGNDTPVLSGNETSAPIGSGNDVSAPIDAPVGSGNDVGSGNEVSGNDVGSGNDTGSGNDVGSGNDTDTDTGVSVGDIGAEVDDVVGDVSGEVDGLLGDILN